MSFFVKPHLFTPYNLSENHWMSAIKNFQELQAYANFNMGFTEYMSLPIFAQREFEKLVVTIKEEKSKALGSAMGGR